MEKQNLTINICFLLNQVNYQETVRSRIFEQPVFNLIYQKLIMNRKNYLLNLTYHFNSHGETKCGSDIVLESNNLQFLGGGLDHIVFLNKNVDDQVVIFKRSSQGSSQNQQTNNKNFAINLMEQVYESIIDRKFSGIKKYRWEKTRMYISNQKPEQINQFFIQLQNILRQRVKQNQVVVPEVQNVSIDRSYKAVQISKNIFKQGEYNTYVEFKPKSILPDLFSIRMINQMSQKFGKNESQIIQILKNQDPIQKTRWFKKNMLKIKQKQNNNLTKNTSKINENPLHIFKIGSQNKNVPNFIKTKLLKILPTLTDQQENHLNRAIFQYIHIHRDLLQNIHQIQSVFPYSPDFINTKINQNLSTRNVSDRASIIRKLQKAIKSVLQQYQVKMKSLDDMYSYLQDFDCVSQSPKKMQNSQTSEDKQYQNLSNFLLFLISLSWKDISLVYRSKFNGTDFQQPQVWIIDDYLKNFNKVLKNVEKDQDLLKKYLKFKLETSTQSYS